MTAAMNGRRIQVIVDAPIGYLNVIVISAFRAKKIISASNVRSLS
jgi:hypothetical protein